MESKMVQIEKYIGAEMELITLMGFSNPVLGRQTQKIHAKTNSEKPSMKEFPQWARNNGDAFHLGTEHNLSTSCSEELAVATYDPSLPAAVGSASEIVADHPDKDAALRMAILRAVIKKYQHAGGAKK
jgi:hypothetical protein